jgi:hypothetical protein
MQLDGEHGAEKALQSKLLFGKKFWERVRRAYIHLDCRLLALWDSLHSHDLAGACPVPPERDRRGACLPAGRLSPRPERSAGFTQKSRVEGEPWL